MLIIENMSALYALIIFSASPSVVFFRFPTVYFAPAGSKLEPKLYEVRRVIF